MVSEGCAGQALWQAWSPARPCLWRVSGAAVRDFMCRGADPGSASSDGGSAAGDPSLGVEACGAGAVDGGGQTCRHARGGRIQALDDVFSEFDPVEDADGNYGRVIGVRDARTNPAVAEDMDVAPERKARVQMLDDTLHDDDAWRNAVELGDKDHEWKTYEPDESVMGLPYQAPAWGKSVQSAVVNNPARN